MKKVLYIMLAVIAVGVASCQKDQVSTRRVGSSLAKAKDTVPPSISSKFRIAKDTVPPSATQTVAKDTVPPSK